MRIVVFSDSHNNYYALKRIVQKQPTADLFIHLGDGERDVEGLIQAFPQKRFLHVAGNCDWGSEAKEEAVTVCQGKRVYYTHGHMLSVKAGLEQLIHRARSLSADIALFGHTHQSMTSYDEGLYLMNPGSVSSPRNGKPSYGMIDLTRAGIVVNIVQL